jgi:hypothetical protein
VRRFRSEALVVAVGFGHPLVGASPAFAARAITVTPSTGLTGLQTITVAGTGLTNEFDTAFVCQGVEHAVPGESLCGQPLQSVAMSNGAFSTSYTVRRFIYVPAAGGRVDCLVTQCSILVDDFPDGRVFTPITFAPPPSPPATRGTVTVTPDVATEGDTVTVEGTGFRPVADIELLQCAPNPVDTNDCSLDVSSQLGTDSVGDFSGTIQLQQTISPPPLQGSVIDCHTAGACVIAAMEVVDIPDTIAAAGVQVAQAPTPDARIRRRGTGEIIGDNTCCSAGDQQFLKRQAAGTKYAFAVQLENEGDVAGDFRVTAPTAPAGVRVDYFVGYYNVTAEVHGAGFTFTNVPAGALRKLAVRFTVDSAAPLGTLFAEDITFRTTATPLRADAVRLGVIVR